MPNLQATTPKNIGFVMLVQPVNNKYNQNFGIKFKLSPETIKAVEKSTGLTYHEMTRLPLSETAKLMEQRGTLKRPSKIKLWLADKYREIGERLGLIEKHYNIYTDVD